MADRDLAGMADMDSDHMAAADNSAADTGFVHMDSADKGFAGKGSGHMEFAVPVAVGIVPADSDYH